ncbi:MAG: AAA family ATPase [Gemmataceae bacterium]
MTEQEKQELLFRCGRVFRPASPLDTRDLFAGRTEQITQAGKAVHTVGQHALIFGQRGVGKSSLANILKLLLENEGKLVVKVNCHKDDTFPRIWRHSFEEIDLIEQKLAGFNVSKPSVSSPADGFPAEADANDVKRVLRFLGKHSDTIFVFDEFDRLQGTKTQRMFADVIKDLSDSAVNSTLILVGVANDVNGLIQEHASIDRSVVQIHMPRMKPSELEEIVRKGMQELGAKIDDDALELIVLLSQGLPHYTHLIAQEASTSAIKQGVKHLSLVHVKEGVKVALKSVQASILDAYQNAIQGQRKGTLFQHVLLACALAEVDEQGYFVSSAVREPMTAITGKPYDIPAFSQHLKKFSSDPSRGPVLEKAGTSRRFRFRFTNPLLQPYVVMRALGDGTLEGDLLELLRAKKQPEY